MGVCDKDKLGDFLYRDIYCFVEVLERCYINCLVFFKVKGCEVCFWIGRGKKRAIDYCFYC